MSRKYTVPHQPKAQLLTWSELNTNEIDFILAAFASANVRDVYSLLEKMFNMNAARSIDKILLDLHYYALKFATDNAFSPAQISAFISIIRSLHRLNQETPFENYQQLNKYFQELIRPPFCVDIFENQTVIKVINYISSSYLAHYKLYKYAFTPITGLNLRVDYRNRTPSPVTLFLDEDTNASAYTSLNEKDVSIKSDPEQQQHPHQQQQPHFESVNAPAPKHSSTETTQQQLRHFVRSVASEHLSKSDFKNSLMREITGHVSK